jgi:xanthine dehydrogenase YagR molybdenum-binding subunit
MSGYPGDWLVGMGMGTAVYPGHRSKSSAKVRLQADGTAQVSLATEDLGTGMWTVVAIVGAQSLGLPIVKLDKLLVPLDGLERAMADKPLIQLG